MKLLWTLYRYSDHRGGRRSLSTIRAAAQVGNTGVPARRAMLYLPGHNEKMAIKAATLQVNQALSSKYYPALVPIYT